jgi:hypothetical protein
MSVAPAPAPSEPAEGWARPAHSCGRGISGAMFGLRDSVHIVDTTC